MDLERALAALRQQRAQLDIAIQSLQLIAAGDKRRGRPARWVTDAKATLNDGKVERRTRAAGASGALARG